jgi:hypothetical protein
MDVAVGKAAVRMRSVDGAKITTAPQIAGALKPRDIATARVGKWEASMVARTCFVALAECAAYFGVHSPVKRSASSI